MQQVIRNTIDKVETGCPHNDHLKDIVGDYQIHSLHHKGWHFYIIYIIRPYVPKI